MGYKIIGVHGLANKPPEHTLRNYWKKSILEGLKRNCGNKEQKVDLEIVYWADIKHPRPIPDGKNDEPYERAPGRGKLKTYQEGWRDEVITSVLGVAAKPLDWAKKYFGVGDVTDAVLAAKLENLSSYYENAKTRDQMRGKLKEKLQEHKDKRLMLIAHSMGSIIAYDVLRAMGREDRHFQVDHLVTIGSPLGLPHVKNKIYSENHLVRTPSVVKKWTNFADRRDPVALDVHLSDDYAANDYGVKVRDDLVINTYANRQGKENHHKSYGYLRAPEMSSAIRAFL